ncbi:MAG: WS/DGAT/MGAT family O-acyltransferase [Acidimicrobiales bacterium]
MPGLDGAFISLQAKNSHLHVAAVLVLDPPEGKRSLFSPSTRYAQIRRVVEQRIHLAPPMRQRALGVPFGLHHPVWADDPEFELDDHLRRASLPAPGGQAELEDLVADVMSRPLDPDRPLWEMVVIEGLAGGRSALVAKLHHAILDGVSGASLLGAFLDLGPRARPIPFPPEPWEPGPLPGRAALLRHAAASLTRQPEVALGALQRGMDAMVEVAGHNRRLSAEGLTPPPAPFSAPRTSLNGTLSSRRRFATVTLPLDDAKLVRGAFGGTVNDVLLAGVSGALRRLLARRGEVPERPLVALVPVSTRPGGATSVVGTPLGNQVSGMLVSLPTDVDDPVQRLSAVARGTEVAKEQERLTGGRLLADLAEISPPALASRAARWASGLGLLNRLPLCNVVVSGVPGPDFALWCAGSRVTALYPVGPVADGVGLNVTAMSYRGAVHVGLLGCRRLVPDVAELAVLLDDALGELVGAALDARGAAG